MANDANTDALDLTAILSNFASNPFAQPRLTPGVDYTVSHQTLDDTPIIRINPITPLKPATKYLVIVTNQVLDADNKAIVPSPDTQVLNQFTASLESLNQIKSIVQGWTQLGGNVLLAGSGGLMDSDNVALSFPFTTGGADTVLKAMAAPALSLGADLAAAAADVYHVIDPPKSRAFQLILTAPNTPLALSPNALGISADTITRYVQGGLTIPVGFSAPTLTDFSALLNGDTGAISRSLAADDFWRGNSALGAIIDGALGNDSGTTPPKDDDESYNVTYRYPHAALNQTQNAPVLITVPGDYSGIGGVNCELAKPWKVAIFAHGITSNRTASVGLASVLASQACIATVAMDLPMHGVAAQDSTLAFNAEQANTLFGATAIAGGISINERHYNIGSNPNAPGSRAPMDFDGSDETPLMGKSGEHFINLFNFPRTRDNMRQGVVDLLNLSASIGDIDATGDGTPDFDTNNISFIGHSLGAIIGTTFVSIINDPQVQALNSNLPSIKAAILGNPGSQMTKLLENSPAFAPSIVGSLAAGGLSQGSEDFEKFMEVLQATIASADPVNFAAKLADDATPILLYNMVGGGSIGDDVTTLPAEFLVSFGGDTYPPDHVVPNYDYFKNSSNPFGNVGDLKDREEEDFEDLVWILPTELASTAAPLAGTNPLISLMGLTTINADSTTMTGTTPIKAAVLLQKGTHATFAGADAATTFAEIATQITRFISTSGTELPVNNTNDIYAPAN
jgi:hypothetical protein